jgi:RNA polymerase sigma-70 factor (ECF subfamily)
MSASKLSSVKPERVSDAAILARVAEGDLGALGGLYDRYAPGLLRFAERVEGPDEAQDIVHAVFLRVVRLAPNFDRAATSARPWLFAITARVLQERRRSLQRWQAALTRLSRQRPRPRAQLADARSDLARSLERLSVAKRTVLVLAEVEGFTCEELAAMLSIPIGTVWTRLHHARRELRRLYEGEP